MKNSMNSCEMLEQILQQFQTIEQENDLFLLTRKFNRLIKKFYQKGPDIKEQLRDLKQAKVYLEYTKKNRFSFTSTLL